MSQSTQGNLGQNVSKTESSHPVADKVKDTLHESVDNLAQKAADAEQRVRDSAQQGSENFAKRKDQLEDSWDQSSVKRYVSENPVKTAGLAFAAGVVLASFLRGK